MRNEVRVWLLFAAVSVGVVVAGWFATDHGSRDVSAYRQDVRELVNTARERNGLGPLRESRSLTFTAQRFARKLDRQHRFAHDARIHVDKAWLWAGEVLAKGQRTPEAVVADWLGSPDHRRILLSARARAIGVGRSDGVWVAQLGRLGR